MPRKSGGCDTCKKRKVKCDETKPYCTRCTTSGLDCSGYTESPPKRTPTFRDQTSRVAARAQAGYAKSRSDVHQQLPTRSRTLIPHAHPASLLESGPAVAAFPSPFDMNTTRETRTQLLSKFLRIYLPDEGHVLISHFAYLYMLPDMIGLHPAIPSAIDALCSVQIGNSYNDPEVLIKSKSLYGIALSRLSKALTRPNLYSPIGTLAAIFIVALCELYHGPAEDNNAWASHLKGAQVVLEICGPAVLETNLGRLLLYNLRWNAICVGIVQRKAVIFDQPPWLTSPNEKDSWNSWTALMDIIVHIPRILERTDAVYTCLDPTLEVTSLYSQSTTLQSKLRSWLPKLQEEFSDGSGILKPLRDMDGFQNMEDDMDVFSEVYSFVNCRDTYMYITYWLCQLTLNRNLSKLHQSGLTGLESFEMTPEIHEVQAFECACQLCMCLPYSAQKSTPFVSRFNASLAADIAGAYFLELAEMEKYNWCRLLSARIQIMGFSIPDVLKVSSFDTNVPQMIARETLPIIEVDDISTNLAELTT